MQSTNAIISSIGFVQSERGAANIPSGGIETYVTSVNLYPGTYCIFGQLTYPSNENGYRHVSIFVGDHNLASDTRNAVKGGSSNISIAAIHTVNTLSQAKLTSMQTSGTSLNANGTIVTVRIK